MRLFAVTLIVLLALSIIFPLLYSGVVSDRDEGVFLLMAREVKDGSVLYKDYADNKPPGIFFMLIPVVMFAGTDLLKIRLAAAFINLLTAIFIFFIGKKISNEKSGSIAAIMYLLIINGFSYIGFELKTETISNLFICAGIYLLISIEQKEWRYVMAGIMFAFAGMIRQVSAYALLLAAYWIWTTEQQKLRKFVLLSIGIVAGLLPFLYYLISNSTLANMLYYTTYGLSDPKNMNAIGGLNIGILLANVALLPFFFEVILLILIATYGLNSSLVKKSQNQLVWGWFILTILIGPISPLMNMFFIMMVMVPLVLLAAIGLQEIEPELRKLTEGKPKALGRYLKLCLILFFLVLSGITYQNDLNIVRPLGGVFGNSITSKDVEFIKEVLEKENRTNAEFYVIMTEPELYYFLDTKSITHFPFMSAYPYIRGDEKIFNEEVIWKVENARPEYIILNDKEQYWKLQTPQAVKNSTNFRNLMTFVERDYSKQWEENEVVIYLRKDLLPE